MDPDPIRAFEHDHASLTILVFNVRDLIASVERGQLTCADVHAELASALTGLGEGLLTHFAREEEGLYPFIADQFPDLRDAVARLQSEHDTICGAALRMSHVGSSGPDALRANFKLVGEVFRRFETAYATHAHEERELLRSVGNQIDEPQRGLLAALTEGL